MKAIFALLLDHSVHNMVRKLAVEVHQAYQIGLVGSQLPPHVSLKQPFLISDLSTLEAYFDQLAKSIDPLILRFPHMTRDRDTWFTIRDKTCESRKALSLSGLAVPDMRQNGQFMKKHVYEVMTSIWRLYLQMRFLLVSFRVPLI